MRLRKLAPVLPDASMNENGKTAGGMSAFKDGRSDLIPFFERMIAWMLDGKMPRPVWIGFEPKLQEDSVIPGQAAEKGARKRGHDAGKTIQRSLASAQESRSDGRLNNRHASRRAFFLLYKETYNCKGPQ